jgi:hypothetical protein
LQIRLVVLKTMPNVSKILNHNPKRSGPISE